MERFVTTTNKVDRPIGDFFFPFIPIPKKRFADIFVNDLAEPVVIFHRARNSNSLPHEHNIVSIPLIESRQFTNLSFPAHSEINSIAGHLGHVQVTANRTPYWLLARKCNSLDAQFHCDTLGCHSPGHSPYLIDKYWGVSLQRTEYIQMWIKLKESPFGANGFVFHQIGLLLDFRRLLTHLSELAIHRIELASVNTGSYNADDNKAKLAAKVKFFQPMKFSLCFGCGEVVVDCCGILVSWYSLLWGHYIRKKRIVLGITGGLAAFTLIWHGIFLLATA